VKGRSGPLVVANGYWSGLPCDDGYKRWQTDKIGVKGFIFACGLLDRSVELGF
jgi:hypothetical protein